MELGTSGAPPATGGVASPAQPQGNGSAGPSGPASVSNRPVSPTPGSEAVYPADAVNSPQLLEALAFQHRMGRMLGKVIDNLQLCLADPSLPPLPRAEASEEETGQPPQERLLMAIADLKNVKNLLLGLVEEPPPNTSGPSGAP
eukprot:RCo031575